MNAALACPNADTDPWNSWNDDGWQDEKPQGQGQEVPGEPHRQRLRSPQWQSLPSRVKIAEQQLHRQAAGRIQELPEIRRGANGEGYVIVGTS